MIFLSLLWYFFLLFVGYKIGGILRKKRRKIWLSSRLNAYGPQGLGKLPYGYEQQINPNPLESKISKKASSKSAL